MAELVLYGLLAIIIAGGLFLVAVRFLPAGEQIAPPLRDEPAWDLPPERSLQPDDIDSVRLPVALRGYRFAETDTLLDRLADEIRERDAEIARLRGQSGFGAAAEVVEPMNGSGPVSDDPAVSEPSTDGSATVEPTAEAAASPPTDAPDGSR